MNLKSLFTDVVNAEHSTVAFIEKSLLKIEGAAPTIERVIDAGLSYVGPVLQFALSASGNTLAAAAAGKIIQQAQSDLVVASALVTDLGPTPSAASMFADVSTNLTGLLSAGHITGAKSVAAVTKAVSEVSIVGQAVQLAASKIAAAAAPLPVVA